MPHKCLSQVGLSPGRVCREVSWRRTTTPPTCRIDLETLWSVRHLQHRRSHTSTLRLRKRCGVRCKTRGPMHYHGTCRAHSNTKKERLIFSLVWTADGQLQHAADIASCRNCQQMSAKSLQRRWKHEIQILLLRQRAATIRAVLPNPSARAEWLLAGIIGSALHHWGHVPPLDVGTRDHDHANSQTDIAIPDDDDIASPANQPTASLQPSSF